MSDCKHKFMDSNTCAYCGVSFSSLQQQMIAGLSDEISKLRAQLAASEQSASELTMMVDKNADSAKTLFKAFCTTPTPVTGLVPVQFDLLAYVTEEARVADANYREWKAGGSEDNSAYRAGMWFAYNDVRNRLTPPTLDTTEGSSRSTGIPGDVALTAAKTIPAAELQPTIELLMHTIIGLGFANPNTVEGSNLWAWRGKLQTELARLEQLVSGKEGK